MMLLFQAVLEKVVGTIDANWGAVALLILAIGAARDRKGAIAGRVLHALLRAMHRPLWQAALLAAVVSLATSVGVFLVRGEPLPDEYDEYSHLLVGEALLEGRLANPQHAMWRHFEAGSEIQVPRYASAYLPGNGLPLALGAWLTGFPIVGLWLASAATAAAMVWAADAWLPRAWSLLAGLLVALHPTFTLWNSVYHGGNVAALGSALLIGAAIRVTRRPNAAQCAVGAIAIVLLAISRSYEGLFLIAGTVVFVLMVNARAIPGIVRHSIGAMAILVLGGFFIAIFNRSVTGSPWVLPHSVHDRQYNPSPHFLWQPPKPRLHYLSDELRNCYDGVYRGHYLRTRTPAGLRQLMLQKSIGIREIAAPSHSDGAFAGSMDALVLLPFAVWPFSLRRKRTRALTVVLLIFFLSLYTTVWWISPQYASPGTAPAAILYVLLLRELAARWSRRGTAFAVAVLAAVLMLAGDAIVTRAKAPQPELERERRRVEASLDRVPGKHLILVPQTIRAFVFNHADIDGSRVVWARQLDASSDAELRRYFRDRRTWQLVRTGSALALRPLGRQ